MTETLFVYLSATASFIFLCVGVFAGWTVNEKLHEYMYAAEEENVHPEMLNSKVNGSMKNFVSSLRG